MANEFSFRVLDLDDLVSASVEAAITRNALYVIELLSRYLDWKGTLDFVVEIRPRSELTWSDADGLLPSYGQIGWNGSAWVNETLEEALTGFDKNPNRPDAGTTIYLAADGTIKNYGSPVWFDPAPMFGIDPGVPPGTHDFVGIFLHEVFHSLGFWAGTLQWDSMVDSVRSEQLFTGAQTAALYGAQLPVDGTSHYGGGDHAITRGLMYQWGNYERNRWDLGRVDLAVLADLGHQVKTYSGLPLFEMLDTALDLIGTAGDDRLYGDYHNNRLEGGLGSDLIEGGYGDDHIVGGGGDDRLFGDSGSDTITGGAGNDVINGGEGADRLVGGPGDDTYIVDSLGDVVVEAAGEGTDTVRTSVGSRSDYTQMYKLPAEVENLFGTAAFAQGVGGNSLNNLIVMGDGADLILLQDGGDDTVVGGGGNDFIYYGGAFTNADRNDGGAGNDTLGLVGNYTITFDADDLVSIEKLAAYSGGSGPEAVASSYSFTVIDANVAPGTQLIVIAQSLLTHETLTFDGSAETDGTFYVRGGRGNDTITGGLGNDTIFGNLGADLLKGGGGNDVFQYVKAEDSTATSRDTILDFSAGDKINLAGIDADAARDGDNGFTFLGSAAFTNQAGQLRAYQAEGGWIVEGDVDGDGMADLMIHVLTVGGHALGAADFVF
jgi:Ca2+-binding RTX toxin-like protein